MTRDERLQWMLLDLADTISELCNREGNGERAVMAMNVANRARKALRDTHGVNLDDLDSEARDLFKTMMDEEFAKADAEKARSTEADALFERARALLDDPKKSSPS